jgi:TonB family protein
MIEFLALVAAAPPAAAPPQAQGIISADDYPLAALKRGEQGPVYFEVLINPQGRVDSCSILVSSGHKVLDEASCQIVTARARFSPAQDENGRPIYGTYRQLINWRIGNYRSAADVPPTPQMRPDFDLTVNQAAQGEKLPLQFAVRYLIKADGTASHCEFSNIWAPRSLVVPPPVLVDLACNAATQSPIQPLRNSKNQPVDAWGGATVRFSTK